MIYLTTMARLVRFDIAPLKRLTLKQLQYFCILNLVILGLIYGCSAAFFSRLVLSQKGFDIDSFNAVKIIIAGVPAAFLLHAGAALFIWVFLRAIGGKANFIMSYFHIGVAAISLWPLAPVVAALQTGSQQPLMWGLAFIFTGYAFALSVRVIKASFQLSCIRMTIATTVTVIYIGCFLYLWV